MSGSVPSDFLSGDFHHGWVPSADIRLHTVECGQGPPVLLLHGFPDHWRLWGDLMQRLARDHRLMAPDLRGINLSDKPAGVAAYRIEHLVDDVLALIDHLGGSSHLIGHDWGGLLAWAVAARHPDRVKRLVILNAPHPCRFAQMLLDHPQQRAASRYVGQLCEPDAASRLRRDHCATLRGVLTEHGRLAVSAEDLEASLQAWLQPGALEAALNWYRALGHEAAMTPPGVAAVPDLGASDGTIHCPTLLVWGERDGSFPLDGLEGLERWVPRLRVHRAPACGHWMLREQPAAVAALIAGFLAERGGEA